MIEIAQKEEKQCFHLQVFPKDIQTRANLRKVAEEVAYVIS